MDRPITVVCIILSVATFSMNYAIKDCTNTLGLVPVNTMVADTQIWNVFTSQFYEKYIIKVACNVAGIVIITKSTKIIGGYDQFGIFFMVCLLSCSIFTSAYCFIRFFSTGIEDMITDPIYGFSGIFMAVLTYGRQQLTTEPIFAAVPKITYNNLPILIILVQFCLWLVGYRELAIDIPFSFIGMLVSWSYLRFFYKFENNGGLLGDRSDGFAFVKMFPQVLHLIVVPMSIAFYNIFAMIGIFPELEVQAEKSKLSHHLRYTDPNTPEIPVPTGIKNADVVQDRRRAKAMKLLDAKMAELNGVEGDGWDEKEPTDDLESSVKSIEQSTIRI